MRSLRPLVGVLFLALVAALIVFAKLALDVLRFRETAWGSEVEKVVEVPPGASGREVVRLLASAGALSDERLARRYLRFLKRDPRPMKAGEYAFAGALRPDDVLERVYRGEVRLHPVTVPEGFRAEEIAEAVERAGLGRASEILALARNPALARELGVPFPGLEGYLFPDTYAFERDPRARDILRRMVSRFRDAWRKAEARRAPGVSLGEGEAVILASVIEKETGRPEERPRISCVFHNRLRRGMPLATDPTVLYAKWLRTGSWSRNLTAADLQAPHPYNTYLNRGLPPGPIASPGAAALEAALAPEKCRDLYFVSRNDGSHVFCPDARCHAEAVRKWQVEYFRAQRRRTRR
ncbi:MAG TPA: endolytic transglycosylase MltG [Anaeromyxobacteraceae bacterium]